MLNRRRYLLVYTALAFLVVSIVAIVPAPAAISADISGRVAFNDVNIGDPNAVYIKYVVAQGLMSGFPDGGYHPNEALTRAQAAVVLVQAAGLTAPASGSSGFKDVSASHWAAGSIIAASQAGYIKGMSADSFKPEDKLTRAQGVSLFMRLSKQGDSGVALPVLNDMTSEHWAARAVAMALDAGMVTLAADQKTFNTNGDFRRGDLACLLALLLTKDPGLNSSKLPGTLVVNQGKVEVQEAGKGVAQTATGSQKIYAGDSINTGPEGEAELNLPDGSGLLLKPNTILTIKESRGRSYIKQDGTPGIGVDYLEVELSQGRIFGALASIHDQALKSGILHEKTDKMLAGFDWCIARLFAANEVPWYKTAETKKVKVKVDMPWGISAIRGSFWSNLVDSGRNTTTLLNGEVEVTSAGKSQALAPGQSSAITGADQAPTPAVAMSADEQKSWTDEKAWTEARTTAIESNRELGSATPAVTAPATPVAKPADKTEPATGDMSLNGIADFLNGQYPEQMQAVVSNNQLTIYQKVKMSDQRGPMTIKESEDCFILSPVPVTTEHLLPVLKLFYPTQYEWILEQAKTAYASADPRMPQLKDKKLDGRFVWFASVAGNPQLYIGKQGTAMPAYITDFSIQ